MTSTSVKTISSNEDDVRFRIYSGDLRIDEAAAELLRLERAQRESEAYFFRKRLEECAEIIDRLQKEISDAAGSAT